MVRPVRRRITLSCSPSGSASMFSEQGIARLLCGDNSHIFASSINVEQLAELKINSEKLYRYIEEELDDREREIICKRYGVPNTDGSLCKPMTQREIAQQIGIS